VSKTKSLALVAAAYVVAFGAFCAWMAWGPQTGHLWLDGLIADLIATVVVFVFSRAYRNSSFYDAYWSVLPPFLMVAWWLRLDGGHDTPAWLALAVIVAWAIRLTGNWAYGWPGLQHEDWRYPMLKEKSGRLEAVVDLMAIHVFPTLQVFAGMLPVYVLLTHRSRSIDWLDIVAVAVGLGAVALEFVADAQMHHFARTKQPGQVIDVGVWRWSRHPNYFGEFSVWLSLALFGLAAAPHTWWWIFVGAALMFALFEFASIPMMEQRSLERRPAYQDVIDRTARFIPRPPRRSA
jgi:steroid 5-alpha reductase family enzyme